MVLFVAAIAGLCAASLVWTLEKTQELSPGQEAPPLVGGKATEQVRGPDGVPLYRTRAKNRVFSELVAGHLTLREAAIFFRILDEADPDFKQEAFISAFSGKSIEERYCREIIGWSWEEEPSNGPEARLARQRLEAEFADLLKASRARSR